MRADINLAINVGLATDDSKFALAARRVLTKTANFSKGTLRSAS